MATPESDVAADEGEWLPDDAPLTISDYSPLLDLPCLTWSTTDGEVNTRKAPTLASLPSSDEVRAFVAELTQPFGDGFSDGTPSADWWAHFEEDRHAAPSDLWAADGYDSTLLTEALSVVSGVFAGLVVRRWKVSTDYPETWGDTADGFRSLTERLFDRLHLNHRVGSSGLPERVATWYDVDGVAREAQQTLFATASGNNAWARLRDVERDTAGLLSRRLVLQPVTSFVMPLEWEEALASGVFPDLEAVLSSGARSALRDLADTLDDAADDLRAGRGFRTVVGWLRLLGGMTSSNTLPGLEILLLLAGTAVADDFAADLEAAADDVDVAAESDRPLESVLRFLLRASRELGLGETLFGLTASHLDDLDRALGRTGFLDGWAWVDRPVALVHLGDDVTTLRRHFGDYGYERPDESASVVDEQEAALRLWYAWREATQPTLDAHRVFEAVGIVLEKLVEIDDTLLATTPLGGQGGLVASWVRKYLHEHGLHRIADIFDGVPPQAVVRYLVRQVLADNFIGHFTDRGYSLTCLESLFCWMDTKSARERIDDALGPVVEIATEELVVDSSSTSPAEEYLLGSSSITTLYVRAGLLPESLRRNPLLSPWFRQSLDEGALRRLLGVYADGGFTMAALDASADECDIERVRAWLADASRSCGDLLERTSVYFDRPERTGPPPDVTLVDVDEPKGEWSGLFGDDDDDEGVIRP